MLFALCRQVVGMSVRFNPHTRRYLRPIQSVLEPHIGGDRLRTVAKMHLVYRRYLDNLPFIWRRWSENGRTWYDIAGEEHVKEALTAGRGAILLSSHSYGISRLIPPILSGRGYRISRVGGWDQEETVRHWGNDSERDWKHLHVGADAWARLRVSKQVARALRENSLVYMSMPNRPSGIPEQEIRIFNQRFFIDPAMMRLFDGLRATVLPCFAICTDTGKIKMNVHPPLTGGPLEMSQSYGELYSRYLTEHPEFCRFWKPLLQRKDQW